jgi:protein-disulfide isomerase
MHALLFENQDALEPDDLVHYAEVIDLDIDRFADEVRAGTHLPKVERDFQSGVRSGVQGTPTFFVNGHHHDRGWDADSLTAAIRFALRGRAAPSAATHPHR